LADPATQAWAEAYRSVAPGSLLVMQAGEASKTWDSLQQILAWLMEEQADRSSVLLVLGGGALSDVGAMAAAMFKRGIPWVSVPTTLLAMVDAAYGGKCAINFGGIKNSVGLYNDPVHRIYYHPYLQTLGVDALVDGWAEIIKHGLVASQDLMQRNLAFFGSMKQTSNQVLVPPDQDLLLQALQVKIDLVALDPRENGPRKLLNFGHTMGHALEALIPSLSHGRAVWLGMIYELGLAVSAGLLARDHRLICYESLQTLSHYVSPSTYPSTWPTWKVVLEHLLQDKKNRGGQILWSLPVGVGKADYDRVVDPALAEQVYEVWIRDPLAWPLIHGNA